MSRPRKYRHPPPARSTAEPSPAEIVELTGNNPRPSGTPVELRPGGGPLEIIEMPPIPQFQLVVALRLAPGLDPASVALAAAGFVSALHAADRKLRLGSIRPGRASRGTR